MIDVAYMEESYADWKRPVWFVSWRGEGGERIVSAAFNQDEAAEKFFRYIQKVDSQAIFWKSKKYGKEWSK